MSRQPRWQPMVRTEAAPRTEVQRAALREDKSIWSGTDAGDIVPREMWVNNQYAVIPYRREEDGEVFCLSIRRLDRRSPRDWRDFQRIKNEIAGPEAEFVERYPAESQLVDSANQFWLWRIPNDAAALIGFNKGRATGGPEEARATFSQQRAGAGS